MKMAAKVNSNTQELEIRLIKNRTRSQVAVAPTLTKNRTYLTRWLHSGCDPKSLSLIHTYSSQTVNTTVENV